MTASGVTFPRTVTFLDARSMSTFSTPAFRLVEKSDKQAGQTKRHAAAERSTGGRHCWPKWSSSRGHVFTAVTVGYTSGLPASRIVSSEPALLPRRALSSSSHAATSERCTVLCCAAMVGRHTFKLVEHAVHGSHAALACHAHFQRHLHAGVARNVRTWSSEMNAESRTRAASWILRLC